MFKLDDGLILALYPRSELAKDASVPFKPPKIGEFSIGHIVSGRDQFDALLSRAETAGARLTGRPHDPPWGSTRATSPTRTGISGKSSGIRELRAKTAEGCGRKSVVPLADDGKGGAR
jgi:hypothetical protein